MAVKRAVLFKQTPPVCFCPSGCTTLDLALGGGWAMPRISNVIGDTSSGKTLLAIEAAVNFARLFPKGSIWYRESEHAFDLSYAQALGMPVDRIDLAPVNTVEAVFEDLGHIIKSAPKPALYILDSLDALSDSGELDAKLGAGYGTGKARDLSELFRRLVSGLANGNVTLLVVSQIRTRIGASTYGKKWTRAGGRALDFYSSQTLFLKQTGVVVREVKGVKRTTGVTIRAKVEKNKLAQPFREAEFELTFNYGVDDLKAVVAFLDTHKALDGVKPAQLLKDLREPANAELRERVRQQVRTRWAEIEQSFLPTVPKYP